jgi:Tfp pilus assembly protein PilX
VRGRRGRESGAALVLVLAVLLILLGLGTVFLRLMGTSSTISANLVARTQALYHAESASHVGAVDLQDHPAWPVYLPRAAVTYPLAGGSISYRLATTAAANEALIVATGSLGGAERALQVRVHR